ncbi:MAG: galactose-1-phosphate uridylyltransferase, partial [Nitrososphaerales archaeon]|nr:galactose-1-phosphate uridylyltransferase [Nitrososphaerales archaeon]
MAELRKDYFLDRYTIISTERANRPFEFPSVMIKEKEDVCPFCPGNESQTPPADLVLVSREGSLIKLSDTEGEVIRDWCVRVFPNQYPAVSISSKEVYGDHPLYSEPAYGYHYVVVATPNHNESFSQMSVEQWINILTTVQDKVRWLYGKKRVAYVSIFINYGRDAGASQSHPHLQILTLPRLPPIIEQEALAVQRSMRDLGVCP